MTLYNIKWTATGFLIVSILLNGLNIYPFGPILQIIGGVFWSYASIRMKDKPLMVTNIAMTSIGTIAILYNYS